MSNVTPTSLPNIDSTLPWHSSREFRWQSSSTGYEHYGMWDIGSVRFLSGGGIKVSTTTDTWEDDGTGNPTAPVENSDGSVSLFHSNGILKYKFTKPTSASWLPLSSGGGTTTEGSTSTPAGTVEKIGTSPNSSTVKCTILASSPSSSGVISYEILRDGVTIFTFTNHSTGTDTVQHTGWYDATFELKMVSTTGLYQTQILAVYNPKRNVFCNFW